MARVRRGAALATLLLWCLCASSAPPAAHARQIVLNYVEGNRQCSLKASERLYSFTLDDTAGACRVMAYHSEYYYSYGPSLGTYALQALCSDPACQSCAVMATEEAPLSRVCRASADGKSSFSLSNLTQPCQGPVAVDTPPPPATVADQPLALYSFYVFDTSCPRRAPDSYVVHALTVGECQPNPWGQYHKVVAKPGSANNFTLFKLCQAGCTVGCSEVDVELGACSVAGDYLMRLNNVSTCGTPMPERRQGWLTRGRLVGVCMGGGVVFAAALVLTVYAVFRKRLQTHNYEPLAVNES